MTVVPPPDIRVAVAEYLNRNVGKVSEWCDLYWMILNASKTRLW